MPHDTTVGETRLRAARSGVDPSVTQFVSTRQQLAERVLRAVVVNGEDECLLDLLFEDPHEAARRVGMEPGMIAEHEGRELQRCKGKRLQADGGAIVRALVDCRERRDMPDVRRHR